MVHSNRRNGSFEIGFTSNNMFQWIVVLLAAVTGTIQLYRFLAGGSLAFLLASAGFFAGIAILLVAGPLIRELIYIIGIPFAFLQIVAYFIVVQPTGLADVSALAVFDTFVQANLIVLLGYLLIYGWKSTSPQTGKMNPRY